MNNYLIINSLEQLKEFATKFNCKEFGFDTEFTSLSWYHQKLIGLSIYSEEANYPATYIQFNFDYKFITKETDPNGGRKKIEVERLYRKTDAIDVDEALPYLLKIFDGAKCICASAKVEWKIFSKYGITNWEIVDDVNLMSWMLNTDTPNDLKWNAKKELGLAMTSYTDTIKQKPGNIDFRIVDWEEYGRYGALDAYATYHLREVFKPRFEPYPALQACYRKLEIPLLYEVARAEMAGVSIDVDFLKEMEKVADVEIEKLTEEIYEEVGVEFNIGSPDQLAHVLFDRMNCPVIRTSEKTNKRSVDEDTLKELAFAGYDIADIILDYRKLIKLKSTYIEALPEKVDPDGRLRGSFNQTGTATGRFSSSGPNLQNIPNDKKFPIKRAFIPKPGYKFLCFDWSTIEIRIMAHESKDPLLSELLNEGRDIHQETTDSINSQYGLTLTRGDGKIINFAVLYLMGKDSLAYSLNKSLKALFRSGEISRTELEERLISKSTAQKIIDGYFTTYKGFAQYVNDMTEIVKQEGWVWTLGGRRRPVPELQSRAKFGFGRRKSVNTPIQGGAGDLMKLGIIKLQQLYESKGYDANTLLYVHDEYVIEVRADQAEKLAEDVQFLMENIYPKCSVPIKCEGGIYDDWAGLKQGAKEIKKSGGGNSTLLNTFIIRKITTRKNQVI